MSLWRPNGWENPLTPERLTKDHNDFEDVAQAYESGADAILEALRKKGFATEERDRQDRQKGIIVFIPDEGEICK